MLKNWITNELMPLLRHLWPVNNHWRSAEDQIFDDLSQLISVAGFDRRQDRR
jgi:hypothetical protein